jgi:hypothetical protein
LDAPEQVAQSGGLAMAQTAAIPFGIARICNDASAPEGGLIGCVAFLTQEVKVIEASKVNVYAALVKITSGQLPFLGLS